MPTTAAVPAKTTPRQEGDLPIVEPRQLAEGRLGKLFRDGSKAALVRNDSRIEQLWSGVLQRRANDSRMPWEASLFELAAHHHRRNVSYGDMIRFVPGEFGHVARKVILYPSDEDGSFVAFPSHFKGNVPEWKLDQETLSIAWDLASSMLGSICPSGFDLPPYAVSLELLRYPRCLEELEAIQACLVDSGGAWAKVGQRVDAHKHTAAGPFSPRGVRDLFGWACLLPSLGPILNRVNRYFYRFDDSRFAAEGRAIIGGPHVDRSKVLTVLSSDRDTITTQIYTDKWTDLPLTSDSMAVFPSVKLGKELGLKPTLHRVLIEKCSHPGPHRPNLTLLLAIVDRPS